MQWDLKNSQIWRFLKNGVSPVIINCCRMFHEINHPATGVAFQETRRLIFPRGGVDQAAVFVFDVRVRATQLLGAVIIDSGFSHILTMICWVETDVALSFKKKQIHLMASNLKETMLVEPIYRDPSVVSARPMAC